MRVFYIGTHEDDYHLRETAGQLHDLQSMVEGFIEPVYFPEFLEMDIILLANEEGLLARLEVNENLWPYFLVGPVVALRNDGENFAGLNDNQIDFLYQWFENN